MQRQFATFLDDGGVERIRRRPEEVAAPVVAVVEVGRLLGALDDDIVGVLRQIRIRSFGGEESRFAPWPGHTSRCHIKVIRGSPAVLLGEDEVESAVYLKHPWSFPVDSLESVQSGVGGVVVGVEAGDAEIGVVVRCVD